MNYVAVQIAPESLRISAVRAAGQAGAGVAGLVDGAAHPRSVFDVCRFD